MNLDSLIKFDLREKKSDKPKPTLNQAEDGWESCSSDEELENQDFS